MDLEVSSKIPTQNKSFFSSAVRKFFTAVARPFIFPFFRKLRHDSLPPSGFVSERILASDGVELEAWSSVRNPKLPTFLLFHGNSSTLRSFTPLLRELARAGKVNVLALDYRGYGYSQGTPSEEGLYRDAEALIAHAESKGIARDNLLFLGESLGSGVAVEMIKRHPESKGAVLVAPYSSVASFYPESFRALPSDRFDSLSKIPNIPNKILILHGGEDAIIPAWHGFRLKNVGENTEIVLFPKEKHAIDPELIAKTVLERLDRFVSKPPLESAPSPSAHSWQERVQERRALKREAASVALAG